MAALVGYYNFALNGWIGLATNGFFLAIGILLLSTWKKPCPKKEKPEELSEEESSSGTTIVVKSAANLEEIDKAETSIETPEE